MLRLQEAIKMSMSSADYTQLDLFNSFDKSVKFDLSLRDVTSDPTTYGDVKNAISRMREINVKIPLKDAEGKGYHISTSLISALIPDSADYKSTISIKIDHSIAQYLINIEKGSHGIAQQYTRYLYEVAQRATSIYTMVIGTIWQCTIYNIIQLWAEQA